MELLDVRGMSVYEYCNFVESRALHLGVSSFELNMEYYFDRGLIGDLVNNGVKFDVKQPEPPSFLSQIFISWFPMLLLIGVWIFFMRQMQGGAGGKGGPMSFGKSKAKLQSDNAVKITFKDVAGVETYYDMLEPFINEMIFSDDIDYYHAIFEFVYYLDDPHTYYYSTGYYQPESFDFTLTFSYYGERNAGRSSDYTTYNNYYEDKYGGSIPTTYLLPDGKTAIIHVPTFSDLTMPDQVQAAIEALPESVENVIMDVALNGGGWNSVTFQLMAFMTDLTFADHSMNPFDGSVSTYYIDSDQDAYDQYNWFVLTSPVSYSASSSFAAMSKELGIPVIGLNAGGGASSVQLVQPFGGSIFVMSSNNVNSIRIFNEETQEYEFYSIEFGVEVDYEIVDFLNDEELMAAIEAILNQETPE